MNKVIFIKNVRSLDSGDWFIGAGWYFIDETWNLQWGGHTEEKAKLTFMDYVNNL